MNMIIFRKIALLISQTLFLFTIMAQDYIQNPYINRTNNFIYGPKELPVVMDSLNILVIGDSHIQADFFTGEFRRLITTANSTKINRGYIFPYDLANTNNPFDYSFTSNLNWKIHKIINGIQNEPVGVHGYSIETNSVSGHINFKTTPDSSNYYTYNSVQFVYSGNASFKIIYPKIAVTHTDKNIFHAQFAEPTDSFSLQITKADKFFLHGVWIGSTDYNCEVSACGINGGTFSSFNKVNLFKTESKLLTPNIIILALGTNDAHNLNQALSTIYENIEHAIKNIKTNFPNANIVLVTPNNSGLSQHKLVRDRLQEIRKYIIDQARNNNIYYWDFYSIMGGNNSIELWHKDSLASNDFIHLSIKGYQLQGKLLFDALKNNTQVYESIP